MCMHSARGGRVRSYASVFARARACVCVCVRVRVRGGELVVSNNRRQRKTAEGGVGGSLTSRMGERCARKLLHSPVEHLNAYLESHARTVEQQQVSHRVHMSVDTVSKALEGWKQHEHTRCCESRKTSSVNHSTAFHRSRTRVRERVLTRWPT